MSRHEFSTKSKNQRVILGWDTGLRTYFLQVWKRNAQRPAVFEGSSVGEIPTLAGLEARLAAAGISPVTLVPGDPAFPDWSHWRERLKLEAGGLAFAAGEVQAVPPAVGTPVTVRLAIPATPLDDDAHAFVNDNLPHEFALRLQALVSLPVLVAATVTQVLGDNVKVTLDEQSLDGIGVRPGQTITVGLSDLVNVDPAKLRFSAGAQAAPASAHQAMAGLWPAVEALRAEPGPRPAWATAENALRIFAQYARWNLTSMPGPAGAPPIPVAHAPAASTGLAVARPDGGTPSYDTVGLAQLREGIYAPTGRHDSLPAALAALGPADTRLMAVAMNADWANDAAQPQRLAFSAGAAFEWNMTGQAEGKWPAQRGAVDPNERVRPARTVIASVLDARRVLAMKSIDGDLVLDGNLPKAMRAQIMNAVRPILKGAVYTDFAGPAAIGTARTFNTNAVPMSGASFSAGAGPEASGPGTGSTSCALTFDRATVDGIVAAARDRALGNEKDWTDRRQQDPDFLLIADPRKGVRLTAADGQGETAWAHQADPAHMRPLDVVKASVPVYIGGNHETLVDDSFLTHALANAGDVMMIVSNGQLTVGGIDPQKRDAVVQAAKDRWSFSGGLLVEPAQRSERIRRWMGENPAQTILASAAATGFSGWLAHRLGEAAAAHAYAAAQAANAFAYDAVAAGYPYAQTLAASLGFSAGATAKLDPAKRRDEALRLIAAEFPDFTAASLPAIPDGFACNAWHNDAMPRFDHEQLGLVLWVDYPEPKDREVKGERFCLTRIDADGRILATLAQSDDWSVIEEAVAQAIDAAGPAFSAGAPGPDDLGIFVEDRRKALGLTLDQLAAAMGWVNKGQAWKFTHGETQLDVRRLMTLAETLECDVSEILERIPRIAPIAFEAGDRQPADLSTFGGRLRAARRAIPMTQDEVAAAEGISRVAVTMWENGTTKRANGEPSIPKSARLASLAATLGVSVDWLLTGNGPAPAIAPATGAPLLDAIERTRQHGLSIGPADTGLQGSLAEALVASAGGLPEWQLAQAFLDQTLAKATELDGKELPPLDLARFDWLGVNAFRTQAWTKSEPAERALVARDYFAALLAARDRQLSFSSGLATAAALGLAVGAASPALAETHPIRTLFGWQVASLDTAVPGRPEMRDTSGRVVEIYEPRPDGGFDRRDAEGRPLGEVLKNGADGWVVRDVGARTPALYLVRDAEGGYVLRDAHGARLGRIEPGATGRPAFSAGAAAVSVDLPLRYPRTHADLAACVADGRVEGSLSLEFFEPKAALADFVFPRGLDVAGALDISGTPIRALPAGLRIGTSLDARDSALAALPADITVGYQVTGNPAAFYQSNLILENTPLRALPENLHVPGSLWLGESAIERLPAGLRVERHLDATATQIDTIPADADIGGSLILPGSRIAHLDGRRVVHGNLDLRNTPLADLPGDLHVEGRLDLTGTKLVEMPANLYASEIIGHDGRHYADTLEPGTFEKIGAAFARNAVPSARLSAVRGWAAENPAQSALALLAAGGAVAAAAYAVLPALSAGAAGKAMAAKRWLELPEGAKDRFAIGALEAATAWRTQDETARAADRMERFADFRQRIEAEARSAGIADRVEEFVHIFMGTHAGGGADFPSARRLVQALDGDARGELAIGGAYLNMPAFSAGEDAAKALARAIEEAAARDNLDDAAGHLIDHFGIDRQEVADMGGQFWSGDAPIDGALDWNDDWAKIPAELRKAELEKWARMLAIASIELEAEKQQPPFPQLPERIAEFGFGIADPSAGIWIVAGLVDAKEEKRVLETLAAKTGHDVSPPPMAIVPRNAFLCVIGSASEADARVIAEIVATEAGPTRTGIYNPFGRRVAGPIAMSAGLVADRPAIGEIIRFPAAGGPGDTRIEVADIAKKQPFARLGIVSITDQYGETHHARRAGDAWEVAMSGELGRPHAFSAGRPTTRDELERDPNFFPDLIRSTPMRDEGHPFFARDLRYADFPSDTSTLVALGVRFANPVAFETKRAASLFFCKKDVYAGLETPRPGAFGEAERLHLAADVAVGDAAKEAGHDAIVYPFEVQVLDRAVLPDLVALRTELDEGIDYLPDGSAWTDASGYDSWLARNPGAVSYSVGANAGASERTGYAARLHSSMQEAGVGQSAAGRAVGLTQASIEYLVNDSPIGSKATVRLAHVLGVSPMWLATGQGDRLARSPNFCPPGAHANYGERVSAAMTHAGINQSELARRLDCKQATVWHLTGPTATGSHFTAQIAQECAVSPLWLETGDPDFRGFLSRTPASLGGHEAAFSVGNVSELHPALRYMTFDRAKVEDLYLIARTAEPAADLEELRSGLPVQSGLLFVADEGVYLMPKVGTADLKLHPQSGLEHPAGGDYPVYDVAFADQADSNRMGPLEARTARVVDLNLEDSQVRTIPIEQVRMWLSRPGDLVLCVRRTGTNDYEFSIGDFAPEIVRDMRVKAGVSFSAGKPETRWTPELLSFDTVATVQIIEAARAWAARGRGRKAEIQLVADGTGVYLRALVPAGDAPAHRYAGQKLPRGTGEYPSVLVAFADQANPERMDVADVERIRQAAFGGDDTTITFPADAIDAIGKKGKWPLFLPTEAGIDVLEAKRGDANALRMAATRQFWKYGPPHERVNRDMRKETTMDDARTPEKHKVAFSAGASKLHRSRPADSLTFDHEHLKRLVEAARTGVPALDWLEKEEGKTPERGLYLVGDHGIYLMAKVEDHPRHAKAGEMAPSGAKYPANDVAYAHQCDPDHMIFDHWYDEKRRIFGGDDGADTIPLDFLEKVIANGQRLGIRLTPDSMEFEGLSVEEAERIEKAAKAAWRFSAGVAVVESENVIDRPAIERFERHIVAVSTDARTLDAITDIAGIEPANFAMEEGDGPNPDSSCTFAFVSQRHADAFAKTVGVLFPANASVRGIDTVFGAEADRRRVAHGVRLEAESDGRSSALMRAGVVLSSAFERDGTPVALEHGAFDAMRRQAKAAIEPEGAGQAFGQVLAHQLAISTPLMQAYVQDLTQFMSLLEEADALQPAGLDSEAGRAMKARLAESLGRLDKSLHDVHGFVGNDAEIEAYFRSRNSVVRKAATVASYALTGLAGGTAVHLYEKGGHLARAANLAGADQLATLDANRASAVKNALAIVREKAVAAGLDPVEAINRFDQKVMDIADIAARYAGRKPALSAIAPAERTPEFLQAFNASYAYDKALLKIEMARSALPSAFDRIALDVHRTVEPILAKTGIAAASVADWLATHAHSAIQSAHALTSLAFSAGVVPFPRGEKRAQLAGSIAATVADGTKEYAETRDAIAARFTGILAAWLPAGDFAAMRMRNGTQADPQICHSHDFCDANMAMEQAFREVVGREPDVSTAADTALWNAAWDHAIDAGLIAEPARKVGILAELAAGQGHAFAAGAATNRRQREVDPYPAGHPWVVTANVRRFEIVDAIQQEEGISRSNAFRKGFARADGVVQLVRQATARVSDARFHVADGGDVVFVARNEAAAKAVRKAIEDAHISWVSPDIHVVKAGLAAYSAGRKQEDWAWSVNAHVRRHELVGKNASGPAARREASREAYAIGDRLRAIASDIKDVRYREQDGADVIFEARTKESALALFGAIRNSGIKHVDEHVSVSSPDGPLFGPYYPPAGEIFGDYAPAAADHGFGSPENRDLARRMAAQYANPERKKTMTETLSHEAAKAAAFAAGAQARPDMPDFEKLGEVLDRAALETDIHKSCIIVQEFFKQDDGGIASQVFSGTVILGDETAHEYEAAWPLMSVDQRRLDLEKYARVERNFLEDEATRHEPGEGGRPVFSAGAEAAQASGSRIGRVAAYLASLRPAWTVDVVPNKGKSLADLDHDTLRAYAGRPPLHRAGVTHAERKKITFAFANRPVAAAFSDAMAVGLGQENATVAQPVFEPLPRDRARKDADRAIVEAAKSDRDLLDAAARGVVRAHRLDGTIIPGAGKEMRRDLRAAMGVLRASEGNDPVANMRQYVRSAIAPASEQQVKADSALMDFARLALEKEPSEPASDRRAQYANSVRELEKTLPLATRVAILPFRLSKGQLAAGAAAIGGTALAVSGPQIAAAFSAGAPEAAGQELPADYANWSVAERFFHRASGPILAAGGLAMTTVGGAALARVIYEPSQLEALRAGASSLLGISFSAGAVDGDLAIVNVQGMSGKRLAPPAAIALSRGNPAAFACAPANVEAVLEHIRSRAPSASVSTSLVPAGDLAALSREEPRGFFAKTFNLLNPLAVPRGELRRAVLQAGTIGVAGTAAVAIGPDLWHKASAEFAKLGAAPMVSADFDPARQQLLKSVLDAGRAIDGEYAERIAALVRETGEAYDQIVASGGDASALARLHDAAAATASVVGDASSSFIQQVKAIPGIDGLLAEPAFADKLAAAEKAISPEAVAKSLAGIEDAIRGIEQTANAVWQSDPLSIAPAAHLVADLQPALARLHEAERGFTSLVAGANGSIEDVTMFARPEIARFVAEAEALGRSGWHAAEAGVLRAVDEVTAQVQPVYGHAKDAVLKAGELAGEGIDAAGDLARTVATDSMASIEHTATATADLARTVAADPYGTMERIGAAAHAAAGAVYVHGAHLIEQAGHLFESARAAIGFSAGASDPKISVEVQLNTRSLEEAEAALASLQKMAIKDGGKEWFHESPDDDLGKVTAGFDFPTVAEAEAFRDAARAARRTGPLEGKVGNVELDAPANAPLGQRKRGREPDGLFDLLRLQNGLADLSKSLGFALAPVSRIYAGITDQATGVRGPARMFVDFSLVRDGRASPLPTLSVDAPQGADVPPKVEFARPKDLASADARKAHDEATRQPEAQAVIAAVRKTMMDAHEKRIERPNGQHLHDTLAGEAAKLGMHAGELGLTAEAIADAANRPAGAAFAAGAPAVRKVPPARAADSRPLRAAPGPGGLERPAARPAQRPAAPAPELSAADLIVLASPKNPKETLAVQQQLAREPDTRLNLSARFLVDAYAMLSAKASPADRPRLKYGTQILVEEMRKRGLDAEALARVAGIPEAPALTGAEMLAGNRKTATRAARER